MDSMEKDNNCSLSKSLQLSNDEDLIQFLNETKSNNTNLSKELESCDDCANQKFIEDKLKTLYS